MKSLKVLAVAVVALAAAACQTGPRGFTSVTQRVYGNANPAVPADWKRLVTRSGIIAYVCPAPQCKEPAGVFYMAYAENTNQEYLIRKKIVSANLLLELNRSVSHASGGRFTAISVRDLTNRETAGFETVNAMETGKGPLYSIARIGVNGGEIRIVTGVGVNQAKARRNLQIGLDGVR